MKTTNLINFIKMPKNKTKKKSGCLKIVGIGLLVLIVIGVIGDKMAKKAWEASRGDIIASIEKEIEAGQYQKALSIGEPHKINKDPDLDALLSKAARLKSEKERAIAKKVKQEKIKSLIAEIKVSKGEERLEKLNQLITLDPKTKEFESEVASILVERKKLKDAKNDFIMNGVGKKVPFDKWESFGSPDTLEGTNNREWLVYLSKIDVSFVSNKNTDEVIFVGKGKSAANDYVTARDTKRKKVLEAGFSKWDGSHKQLTDIIKKSMNDPKSYDHDTTKYSDEGDHLIVITKFRGKNAFGGVVLNWVRAKVNLDGSVIEVLEQGP